MSTYSTSILTQALLDLHPISENPATVSDMGDKFVLILVYRIQRQPYPDRTTVAAEMANVGITLVDKNYTIEIMDWYRQVLPIVLTPKGKQAVLQRASELSAAAQA